jgi:transposase InsO family protein
MAPRQRLVPQLSTRKRLALFRYQVVSAVKLRLVSGKSLAEAVFEVAGAPFLLPDGTVGYASLRSIYRWWSLGQPQDGLDPFVGTPRSGAISTVLSPAMIEFLASEKTLDRYASVPELIRRATERGVLAPGESLSRTSVWRACQKLGLPLRRLPGKHEVDSRRWAYPHRMQMLLADGKYFRAGPYYRRRVVIFFLDDATRRGLEVVVGTDGESAVLFLRGLYRVVESVGLFDILFVDWGPGFRADDTAAVCQALHAYLVHGRERYPEGHGKIERFQQTAGTQCLRGLAGAADVDDDPRALELRFRHYLLSQYNHHGHEGLGGQTPQARWDQDERPLRFPESLADLKERFVLRETRRVSADHVVSFAGTLYEVPRGHAQTVVDLWRCVLSGTLSMVHDGKRVILHPLDPVKNAYDRRAHGPVAPAPDDDESVPQTAASLAFARDFSPVVDSDGGYRPKARKEDARDE